MVLSVISALWGTLCRKKSYSCFSGCNTYFLLLRSWAKVLIKIVIYYQNIYLPVWHTTQVKFAAVGWKLLHLSSMYIQWRVFFSSVVHYIWFSLNFVLEGYTKWLLQKPTIREGLCTCVIVKLIVQVLI